MKMMQNMCAVETTTRNKVYSVYIHPRIYLLGIWNNMFKQHKHGRAQLEICEYNVKSFI